MNHKKPRERANSNTRVTDCDLDLAVLEDRTLYSGTPITVDIDVAEDAGNTLLDLQDLLQLDDATFNGLELEIKENTNSQLFDLLRITADGNLEIDYAGDQNGLAKVLLTATSNSIEQEIEFNIDVESINDAPMFLGFENHFTKVAGSNQTIIDLFASFDDVEDDDSNLEFQIVGNSNTEFFKSITIDQENGHLILEHHADAQGAAEIHVVATDRGGLTAGWGTDDDFKIYDFITSLTRISDSAQETANLQELKLWTSWPFFVYENGEYDYSRLDEAKFRSLLNTPSWTPDGVPVVFDIENDYYLNNEVGRDRFARILQIANAERPDLDIGIYRILPERNWYAPVSYHRAIEDAAKGLNNFFGRQLDEFTQDYLDWHARNSLFRTEEVSEQFGGGVLADQIDTVNPSLYTLFSEYDAVWSRYYDLELDHNQNTLTVVDQSFEDVQRVILAASSDASLRNGLSEWTSYYVVNADGNQFQLSHTVGGPAIDFDNKYSGSLHVAAVEYSDQLTFNRNIIDWHSYAEENIAEARKMSDNVNVWISPSVAGAGVQYHSQDFFRLQLDILRPLTDGLTIFEFGDSGSDNPDDDGWWKAVEDFVSTFDDPAATFALNLAGDNAPVAVGDSLQILEDTGLTLSSIDLRFNDLYTNESTQVEILSLPEHGTFDTIDGRFHYRPSTNFNGTDSFSYRLVNDGKISNVADVAITVTPDNDAPIQRDDLVSLNTKGERVRIFSGVLLANDFDVDDDSLSIIEISQPKYGTAELINGHIFYTPGSRYEAIDHLSYKVSDGSETSDWAKVSINIDKPLYFELMQPLFRAEDLAGLKAEIGIVQSASQNSNNEVFKTGIIAGISSAVRKAATDLDSVGNSGAVWKVTAEEVEELQQRSRVSNNRSAGEIKLAGGE